VLLATPGWPREDVVLCGAHRDRWHAELQLHRKAQQRRDSRGAGVRLQSAAEDGSRRPATTISGDLVLMEDADGVVSKRNSFDLDSQTVTFLPAAPDASRYTFSTSGASFDNGTAQAGTLIDGFGDDDSREFTLPFPFPFYGRSYSTFHVNADGNLTFLAGDVDTGPRALDRVTTGPPRLAPLFSDLNPPAALDGVRVYMDSGRAVVSWVSVPLYSNFGQGLLQTFQVRLYADGRIEFAYSGINTANAVVAISPGQVQGVTRVVSFAGGSEEEFSGTIAESFTNVAEVDPILVSQKFYEEHEDAYDYLVFYNNMGIDADTSTVAYEISVRNHRSGFGEPTFDFGKLLGSEKRLQAIMNLGPLFQYPDNPQALVPRRGLAGDTPLTVLAHEAGHLFLAFASTREPDNPDARPMLSADGAHWNFAFNSEASLLEGNRICDRELTPDACPADPLGRRFTTTGTVERYSPLDQYLMGFRAPWDVPDTFYVENPTTSTFNRFPQSGVRFDGTRRDVSINDVIAAEGRRTPDYSVAQRKFRFAFILIHRSGQPPTPADIEKVDLFRREFETFFNQASSGLAAADTTLGQELSLSVFPAAGVLLGSSSSAAVSISEPAPANLEVLLTSASGAASLPSSVTIPAGAASASFSFTGAREGVDEIRAGIPGGQYAPATAKIQVLGAATALRLVPESGHRQAANPGQPLPEPVVVRITDVNNLPYPGIALEAASSAGGFVSPAATATDASGRASFRWTPAGADEVLTITPQEISGAPPALVISTTGPPSLPAAGIVNGASFQPQLSPGAIGSIFGLRLAGGAKAWADFPLPNELEGVRVLIGGGEVPLFYVSNSQINFLIPSNLTTGETSLVVTTPVGSTEPVTVMLLPVSPAIFVVDDSGEGAVLVSGSQLPTSQQPASPGGFVEIFCTGLGPVSRDFQTQKDVTVSLPQVTVDRVPAEVVFSGLAPGFAGLYQVNVRIPAGVAAGNRALSLSMNGVAANAVWIAIQ